MSSVVMDKMEWRRVIELREAVCAGIGWDLVEDLVDMVYYLGRADMKREALVTAEEGIDFQGTVYRAVEGVDVMRIGSVHFAGVLLSGSRPVVSPRVLEFGGPVGRSLDF